MNGDSIICRAIAALAPLVKFARFELQKVMVRIDREGITIAGTDGKVAAIVCSEQTYGLEPCDGFLPAFAAAAFERKGEYLPSNEDEEPEWHYGYENWEPHWRLLLQPTADDGTVKLENVFGAFGLLAKPRSAPQPMPLTLPKTVQAAILVAVATGVRQMHWCPGSPTEAIRVDALPDVDQRDPFFRLVLAIMPARANNTHAHVSKEPRAEAK